MEVLRTTKQRHEIAGKENDGIVALESSLGAITSKVIVFEE
jgi:hypothetical protein